MSPEQKAAKQMADIVGSFGIDMGKFATKIIVVERLTDGIGTIEAVFRLKQRPEKQIVCENVTHDEFGNVLEYSPPILRCRG